MWTQFPHGPMTQKSLLTAKTTHETLTQIESHSLTTPRHNGPSPTEMCCGKPERMGSLALQMFTNNVAMENLNADISTVLKIRPNYSTSEWNRKGPVSLPPSHSSACSPESRQKKSKAKDEMMEQNQNDRLPQLSKI